MTDNLQLIAGDVTSSFLQGLDSLHNLTKKVSEERELNPSEIEQVAQLVNKEVQIRMYSDKGPQGAFEFDMVDPSAIVSEFNTEFSDPLTEKKASSPWISKKSFADNEDNFTGDKQFKGSFLLESKDRLELDLDEMQDMINKTSQDIETGYTEVYDIMKEAMLAEYADAGEILAYVRQESPAIEKLAMHIIGKALDDISGPQGYPASLLVHDSEIPVDKFKGGRSMIKQLNTLVDQHDKMEVHTDGYMQIRDSIKYVVEGINSHLRGEINVD